MSLQRFILVLAGASILSCHQKENAHLKSENDSLRQEIEFRDNILIAMNDVNEIADSILNIHGLTGDTAHLTKYMERIDYLHKNLLESKIRIGTVRRELAGTQEEAQAYNLMVMALQDEVSLRDKEIVDKHNTIDKHARTYKGNISALEKELAKKDQELVQLKEAIEEIRRLNAAESFFIKAQRLEEQGRRIRFAPKKRKDNFREAIELYQKSFTLGKKEAAGKIVELKKHL
jgi:uncharacterized protein (DUF3084 family)